MSDESMLYFAMEYVEGKELRPILRSDKSSRRFNPEVKKKILSQIVDALRYMHTKGIIYGDLKSANIIILKDNTIKLIDFGLSLWIPPHQSTSSVSSFKKSFAIDWFLFGVLLFEFATDGKVFRDYCPDPEKWRKLQRRIKCPCSVVECDLINALVLEKGHQLSEEAYLDLIYNHAYFKS
jgi:serine/threonine protein kinase